jgi:cellulose synthase/poly-beta-1,6-N-acetylglucosamine synthase-like glycosyltransferase
VDDNSTDRTVETASGYMQLKNLRIIKNGGSGKKIAILTGVNAAKGELIAVTDADCRPVRTWLKTIMAFFKQTNAGLVIGPVMINGKKGFFQGFQELEFLSLQGVTAASSIMGNPVLCNGANLAFRKELYLNHYDNLHHELLSGDDIFFLHSVKKEGSTRIEYLYSGDAVVKTRAAGTAGQFMRQRARWISKSGAIRDPYSRFLAIVTFVTIMTLLVLTAGAFFFSGFLKVLGIAFLIKIIADIILLAETGRFFGRLNLLKWFIPSEFVYPFYVVAVFLFSRFRKEKW